MSPTQRLALAATVLALGAAFGCRPGQPEPEPTDRTAVENGVTDRGLASSLQVEHLGDSLRFTLQVTNVSGEPLELTYPTGQSFDFEVHQDGRELWRWSEGMMFTQAIRQEALAAEQTRMHQATWVPPAGAEGEFTVRGYLTAQEQRAAQETRFALP